MTVLVQITQSIFFKTTLLSYEENSITSELSFIDDN